MIDIVTVFHNKENYEQSNELCAALQQYEPNNFTMFLHSNMVNNKGFSKACNIEAARGSSRVIGFLNPDVVVEGPFVNQIEEAISGDVVIAGSSFGKPREELKIWGVKNWVCGAAFFVSREWFEKLGGFDERFVWSHEETDMIRTTELLGKQIADIEIPISHSSPAVNSPQDTAYKTSYFDLAAREYYMKWRR